MRFIKTFLLLFILVAVFLFFLQNSTELEKEFIFNFKLYVGDLAWSSGPVPFFFVVIMAFTLGCLATVLLLGLDRFKLTRKIRRNEKRIKTMEKELQGFRQLPLNHETPEPPVQRPALPEV